MNDYERMLEEDEIADSEYTELRAFCSKTFREIGRERLSGPKDLKPAYQRLNSKAEQQNIPAVLFVHLISPRGLTKFQNEPAEREAFAADLIKRFEKEFQARLSPSNWAQYRRYQLEAPTEDARIRIKGTLDDIILDLAPDIGPRIFLLPMVMARVSDWAYDRNENHRYEQLFRCLIAWPRREQGLVKLDLGPWATLRPHLITEIKVFRNLVLRRFSKSESTGHQFRFDLRQFIEGELIRLDGDPGPFPTLAKVNYRFINFLHTRFTTAASFFNRQISPAEFVNQVIGWATHRDPESARQMISGLPYKRKRSRKRRAKSANL